MQSPNKSKYQQRFTDMKNEVANWTPVWKDISKYIVPTRGFFEGMLPNGSRKIDHRTVLSGHPDNAVTTAAAGITSGLTSPSRPWFKLGLPRRYAPLMENKAVKNWLEDSTNVIMDVFAQSNIYKMLHNMYEELLSFGTACSIIVDDSEDIIRAKTLTCGEYFLDIGPDGRVNTFGRQFFMTAPQMIQEFGMENVSHNVKQAYIEGNLNQFFTINHLIELNDDRLKDRKDFKNMKYRSIYWENTGGEGNVGEILAHRGFNRFIVLAPRWQTVNTSDVYGVGPGWKALGDIRMLYKMISDKSMAVSKIINPPLQKDASVDGEVNAFPGGLTNSSALTPNAGVRPAYQINPNINDIRMDIAECKQDISKAFFSDLFLMMNSMTDGKRTAREVIELHEEKLQILGPAIENLQNELLGPCISIAFERLLEIGLLPEAPKELQGLDITVEYISTLAQAQKALSSNAIEQTVAFIGNMAAVYPDVVDIINSDEAGRMYGDIVGAPSRIVRGKDELAALREAKANAMAEQQQREAAMQDVQAARLLSETEVGRGTSALDAVMGAR